MILITSDTEQMVFSHVLPTYLNYIEQKKKITL